MVVVAAWFALPTIASACDMKIGFLFMGIPSSSWSVGGGLNVQPGSDGDDTYWAANVDAAVALGERAVVIPGIGYCTRTGDDAEGEIVFGGGLGFNLWNNADGTVMVNLQGAVTHVSEGDYSAQSIPVSAAAMFEAGESASVFAGGGLQFFRDSFDGDSESDNDPFVYGGVAFGSSVAIQVGGSLRFGEHANDFAFNIGASIPMGG